MQEQRLLRRRGDVEAPASWGVASSAPTEYLNPQEIILHRHPRCEMAVPLSEACV